MAALAALKFWMIATALLVAPFHRFAAAYVGCYALAVVARDLGGSEPVVNLAWHLLALGIAAAFPVLRRGTCFIALWLFGPLLLIDTFRLKGWVIDYHAWWAVWAIVMAQITLLHLSVDGECRRRGLANLKRSSGEHFFRTGIA